MKVILKNVNLLDGTKDMKLRQGVNVLIEDGKFKKITTDNIEDSDAKVYDLTGKYLTPGLINLHIHLPASGFPSSGKTDSRKLAQFIIPDKLLIIVVSFILAVKLS